MPVVTPMSTSPLSVSNSPINGCIQLDDQELLIMGKLNKTQPMPSVIVIPTQTSMSQSSPSIPVTPQRQQCSLAPSITSLSRRAACPSRNSSFGEDLTALSEVDEDDHHDYPHAYTQAPTSYRLISPSQSCSGIWLCSKPPQRSTTVKSHCKDLSPTPTITTPLPPKKNRPVIVRSMSTGRLAREFDDSGRVICLSVHSDRVLSPSVSPPSSFRNLAEPSQSTPALLRSQSHQPSRRSPTSPSDLALNKLGLPVSIQTSEHTTLRQSSTDRLVTVPSSLIRTSSGGSSWRKKAWQFSGRSVRV